MRSTLSAIPILLACTLGPVPAAGQQPGAAWPLAAAPFVTIGSQPEDSLRLSQLRGESPVDGFLIREPSTLSPTPADGPTFIAPSYRSTWNSDLPFSLNEGAMWAGRGLNLSLLGGFRVAAGPVVVTIAPEFVYQENLPFQIFPSPMRERSHFASPWHSEPESLDLPLRFGSQSRMSIGVGQSSVRMRAGAIEVGLTSENQWWGPGIRNALVMSNNAPGFPHAFVRTAAPLHNRAGRFEWKILLGRLTESRFFDKEPGNDHRSIAAGVFTYRPAVAPDLTLGFARAVYAPMDGMTDLLGGAIHLVQDVGRPNDRPPTDLERDPGPDQIFSAFGRWVLPGSGLEAYFEWAKNERPRTLRDLLVTPHHAQAYTLGLQWARPVSSGAAVRLQAETSFLEASTTVRYRRVTGFYKSRPVPQGYTHRGRILGAAIGTGGSGQWLAADLIGRSARVGLFAGRIRWENDAFFGAQVPPFIFDHDVSVFGGLRAGVVLPRMRVESEIALADRLNYLFQNPSVDLTAPAGVDIRNLTFRLRLTPVHRARASGAAVGSTRTPVR